MTTPTLTDRQFDVICAAYDARGWLSLGDLALAVGDMCHNWEHAKKVAADCASVFVEHGLMNQEGEQYAITPEGRNYLDAPVREAV